MADKLHPRGLDGTGLSTGRYAVNILSGKILGWVSLPATLVESVVRGTRIRVDNTDPKNPVVSLASEQYVLTTVVDGVPQLVWDAATLSLDYTEVSLP